MLRQRHNLHMQGWAARWIIVFLPLWFQSAVGFEYAGKTEKHASQKGEDIFHVCFSHRSSVVLLSSGVWLSLPQYLSDSEVFPQKSFLGFPRSVWPPSGCWGEAVLSDCYFADTSCLGWCCPVKQNSICFPSILQLSLIFTAPHYISNEMSLWCWHWKL